LRLRRAARYPPISPAFLAVEQPMSPRRRVGPSRPTRRSHLAGGSRIRQVELDDAQVNCPSLLGELHVSGLTSATLSCARHGFPARCCPVQLKVAKSRVRLPVIS